MTTTPCTNVRYGFIGCGMMGHEHLRNLALFIGQQHMAVRGADKADAAQPALRRCRQPGCDGWQ